MYFSRSFNLILILMIKLLNITIITIEKQEKN